MISQKEIAACARRAGFQVTGATVESPYIEGSALNGLLEAFAEEALAAFQKGQTVMDEREKLMGAIESAEFTGDVKFRVRVLTDLKANHIPVPEPDHADALVSAPVQQESRAENPIVDALLNVAQAAFWLCDDTCDDGDPDVRHVPHESFENLSKALDVLDDLPDDKPGYTLDGPARAQWALSRPQPDHAEALAGALEQALPHWARANVLQDEGFIPTAAICKKRVKDAAPDSALGKCRDAVAAYRASQKGTEK